MSAPQAPAVSFSWRARAFAVAYGLSSHVTFLAAVTAMVVGLHEGLRSGLGPLQGWSAVALDAALVLQFPFLHSLLLSRRGTRLLARLAPAELSRPLATTRYAWFASAQVLLVFALWSPTGVVWWEAQGAVRWALQAFYACSWVLVVKTMNDAGLGIQLGSLGWGAIARGRAPSYPAFPTQGSFRCCRQPIYAAFALTLWTGPVWTPDRLGLALVWTACCLVGPRLKEARYLARYGEAFARYQQQVPLRGGRGDRRPLSLDPAPQLLAVILELASLLLLHTAWMSALLLSALNALVLFGRIRTEEAALGRLPVWRRAREKRPG